MLVVGCLRGVVAAVLVATSLAAPIAAYAAQPVAVALTPEEQKKIELLRRYFKAIEFDKLMDGMMGSMSDAMMRSMSEEIPDELRRPISEAAIETVRTVMPLMMVDMEVAMAKVFTAEELEAAVAFYESPVGRSMAVKSQQLSAVSGELMTKYGPIMEEQLKQRLCDKFGCKDDKTKKGA